LNIGKKVWTKYGNAFRAGTVVEEKKCGDWLYVRVDWVDDRQFEMDRQRLLDLRGKDYRSDWSRIDHVNFFNKEEMINKINKV
jgi:hypothetical protein|tara:strand:+ start:413 stop:661 length:249 start_codon:yes stop_codon:yes gene_type:complete